MTQTLLKTALTLFVLLPFTRLALAQNPTPQQLQNWHQWRGPHANGFAPGANPPAEWSETKNVKWKVAIPGKGFSTPIVWGDRIYLLTAIPAAAAEPTADFRAVPPQVMGQGQPANQPPRGRGQRRGGGGGPALVNHKFDVICLDRRTGQTIWQKTARETVPHEGHHQTSTFAPASPVTDGQYLYASFGSRGIYAFDMGGDQKWEKDLGQMKTRNGFGEGASPALHSSTLVVPWDHEGDSFIVALDAATGAEKWRQPREEIATWATPLVVPHAGRVQVITNGENRVRSYDLASGELIWECGGQGPNAIPTPVLVDDTVVCMTGYQRFAAYAIPLDSKGDVTDTDKPRWKLSDGTPYVSSPVLYDGLLYFTKNRNNLLTSVDARTGEVLIDQKRLPEVNSLYASPVAAAGRIYFCSLEGVTVVLEHGRQNELKVLHTNQLSGEAIAASPAIIGREMYLRTAGHLYCLAETP
jgi:outer membrane protein assembly factor BamB